MENNMDLMPKGHIVKDYNIGSTRVLICDDYCRDQTDEEVRDILKRLAEICRPSLVKYYMEHPEELQGAENEGIV